MSPAFPHSLALIKEKIGGSLPRLKLSAGAAVYTGESRGFPPRRGTGNAPDTADKKVEKSGTL